MKIRPGVVVEARNGRFRIEKILSMGEMTALNLDTHKTEILRVGEINLSAKQDPSKRGRPNVHDVSPEKWAAAERKYDAVKELSKKSYRTAKDVEKVAKKLNCSVTTVYRYLKDAALFESPVALLRRTRLEHPTLGFDLLPEDRSPTTLEEIVVYVARQKIKAHERCSRKKFSNDVVKMCGDLKLHKPHPNSVIRLLTRLEPGIRIAVLKGRKAGSRLEAVPGEFADKEFPYNTFQIDHTPLDIMIVDEKRRPIGRAWITLLIELYSRVVPGFSVAIDAPSVESISSAIRHAVLRKDVWLADRGIEMTWPIFGKPVTIHADNAKEFRGDVLRRVCKDHTMDLVWRPVKKPRYGAHIERLNGTLAAILKDVKGATYSNPNERQDYDSEGNAMMTIDELEVWLAYRIGVIYHRERHSGIDNQRPLQRLNEAIAGTGEKPGIGMPPLVVDERRLYIDFLPRFHHVIQPNGVRIEYVRYFEDELRSFVGEKDPDYLKKNRKWAFARDDRQISPIYFYNPRTDSYVDVHYANLSRPQISVWELRAAKAYLAAHGGDPTIEEEIFYAYEKLREIEQSAEAKTKAARRELESKRRRQNAKKADDALPGKSPAPTSSAVEVSDTVADAIEPAVPKRVRKIFDVEEKS